MASYDFFTQPQGPNVSVSLFGDAAVQGANVGNAVKTPLAAGIEGVLSGIQTGQKIQSNQLTIQGQQQENVIRQNQVERLPVTNAIQDEQLRRAQDAADIEALQLKLAKDTEDLKIREVKAELENKVSKAEQEKIQRDQEVQFAEQFQAGTDQDKINMIFGGQYNGLFLKNKALYENAVSQIYNSPSLPEGQRQLIDRNRRKSQLQDYQSKLAQQRLPQFYEAYGAYLDDPLTGEITSALQANGIQDVTPEEYAKNTRRVPEGKFTTNTLGQLVPNPDFKMETWTGNYDVYYEDGKRKPFLAAQGVPKDSVKAYNRYATESAIQHGGAWQAKIAELDAVGQQVQQGQVGAQGTAQLSQGQGQVGATPQTRTPPVTYGGQQAPAEVGGEVNFSTWKPTSYRGDTFNGPEGVAVIKSLTGVSDEAALKIAPSLNNIAEQAAKDAVNPPGFFERNFGGESGDEALVRSTISREVSDDEYSRVKDDGGVKFLYNETTLKDYQDKRAEVVTAQNLFRQGFGASPDLLFEAAKYPQDANSVEDLYYIKNKGKFEAQADSAISQVKNKARTAVTTPTQIETFRKESLAGSTDSGSTRQFTPPPKPARAAPAVSSDLSSVQNQAGPRTIGTAAEDPSLVPSGFEPNTEVRERMKVNDRMAGMSDEQLGVITPIEDQEMNTHIITEAQRFGVDPKLVLAMIEQESGGKQSARSKKGAIGLMQLMSATAKDLGVDPKDPKQNVTGGIRYIKQLLDRYDGNVRLALAAYNGGMGNVDKYKGIPPFKETQDYVKKILKKYGRSGITSV